MSITTTLTAVKNIIKKVDGFTDDNVGIGTYLMLDRGVLRAAILLHQLPEYGPGVGRATTGKIGWYHKITVRLFSKYKGNEADCYSDLLVDVSSVVTKLTEYPKLNAASGVTRTNISGGGEPYPVPDRDGEGTAFFGVDLALDVWEESTPSYAETA